MKSARRVCSPLIWFGGKGSLRMKIIPLLEAVPHTHYCEPFGGGASVLLGKAPVPLETYNDIDLTLYTFFTTLADPARFEKFYRRVALLPVSRRLYDMCSKTWRAQTDPDERVWRWYVMARQSFGGHHGWGYSRDGTRNRQCERWLRTIDQLPAIHARLQRVQIECDAALNVLARYDTPGTLFYCDPPYVHDTRRDGKYAHEMNVGDHQALVTALTRLQGHAVLSCYDHPVYTPLLDAGWQRYHRQVYVYATGTTRATWYLRDTDHLKRTETLYVSPGAWRAFGLLWARLGWQEDAGGKRQATSPIVDPNFLLPANVSV